MACEPIPGCEDCTGASESLTCQKAVELRCKLLSSLEQVVCMPSGPIQIEGLKYESKSAAMKALQEAIDWTFTLCAKTEDSGVAIESSSAMQCGGRETWWGSCR